ncbi:MAG TPA: cupin domain-containing protein [Saprospiraceae bacterium]|nr:cupin domain-containing protein [Saprospiraceae bacterium]HMQ84144.1 cupin domain-containing protein [Saprospiraceae bacterium]
MGIEFLAIQEQKEKILFPGFHARLVHGQQLSVAYVDIAQGSQLPEHHHVHEQITNILEGELEMTIGGETRICTPGTVVVIPSNVPHSARALTDCKAIDVFSPVREDYR